MGSAYQERFLELFRRRGEAAIVLNGAIFKRYSGMVVPFGPAEADYSLTPADASHALRSLGGVLVRTTTGLGSPPATAQWYAVICRQFTPIERVPSSNTRSKLRRALKNCEVRRMSAEELAGSGYDVYRSAHARYRGADAPASPSAFQAHALASADFDDVVHHWAVLCDGRLAGYSSNYVFGDTEAVYSTLKFHPDYLRKYASYALLHRMNEFYLAQRKLSYVNDGFRTIRHGTELQQFLERTFGFEKAYTGIDVHYRYPVRLGLRATFPLRRVISRLDDRAKALYELESAVRAGRVGS
jgi:hypothetical protein